MRHVSLRPDGLEFGDWQKRAAEARNTMIQNWKSECEAAAREGRAINWKPQIDEKLYKGIRQVFLFKAFHYKCAYCEAAISANDPIQVDHYRPKGMITENRASIGHPGYFWLAYEWWNLLPSCHDCNTDHTDPRRDVTQPGKKNEFPVGFDRVCEPSDDPDQWQSELAAEAPSLINPYFDNPEDHIEFDPLTGVAIPANASTVPSRHGKATIDLCDLKRPSLCEKRLDLQTDALDGMISRILRGEDLDSVAAPEKEFSAWRKCLVRHRLKEMCRRSGLAATSSPSSNKCTDQSEATH